jgi:hypothetical protein
MLVFLFGLPGEPIQSRTIVAVILLAEIYHFYFYLDSEGQETGAIAPTPENARKNI